MRILLIACALACLAHGQPGQPAVGSVSGRVLSKISSSPVRGAYVMATQHVQEHGLGWTDQEGRFTISGLAPGRYTLIAGKPVLGMHGRSVQVRPGEETRDIEIFVSLSGILAGRVRDADDLPVEKATVSARTLLWSYGRPHEFGSLRTETNDRGEFRLIQTWSSPFFLVLRPPARPDVAGRYRLLHPPLFYPNAVNPAEAEPVSAEAGAKLDTLDFEVPAPADTTLRILARAAKHGDQPHSCVRCQFSLSVRHREAWLEVLEGQASSHGVIEIHGLHPGVYRIAIAGRSGDDDYAGYADVFAAKGQVRNEEVTAWSGRPAPVLVTLVDPPEELRSPDARWTAEVYADPLEPRYPERSWTRDGAIEGAGLRGHGQLLVAPGQWVLRVSTRDALPEAYVQQVLTAGRPQPGPFVTVSREGFAPPIEIRLAFAHAMLSGKVSGAPAFDPARDATRALVHAIPESGDGYAEQTQTVVRENGEFAFEVVPGAYLLFAVPPGGASESFDLADPAIQARYVNFIKRVTLAPGESKRIELEAIP